jgi:HrpA-like RNA helicase
MLSTERVWLNVSVTHQSRREQFESCQHTFADPQSDHLAFANIYDGWEKSHRSESWCRRNFLQIRALRQAGNIYAQLKDYLRKVDVAECKKYIIVSKHTEQWLHKPLKRHKRVALSLCYGFFMNACRKVYNQDEGTYVTANEGHLAHVDSSSSLALQHNYPEWLLYTEASGTAKGTRGW